VFLKNLKIQNEDSIIRDITFHKGINLIVDETTTEEKTESGNSVGKTTVLRLIDFCLDGTGKNIYTDPEFKTTNSKIEKFLKENNVVVTLTLVDDLDSDFSRKVVVQRNFLSRKNKIQMINGETKTNPLFSKELQELIFNTTSERPTFKQLKSKNIRDEKNKLSQTIKVLDHFSTNAVYEALHLFWFGVDVDLSKDNLVREKNLEEKLQGRLRKESNLSQINQSIIIVDNEIKALNKKRSSFQTNENFEEKLKELNSIKSNMNIISSRISHFEMRAELINESKEDLEREHSAIDEKRIESLYRRANKLIPNLQKTFKETLQFHNDMISQKMKFITEDLPELANKLSEDRKKLNLLIREEKELSDSLSQSVSLEDLEKIIAELNTLHEKRGALEEQKSLWERSNGKMVEIDRKLSLINDEILSKDDLIQTRIAEFNSYFSDISKRLDGEHSLLSAENIDGIYKFAIGNIDGNPGTGGKKSQMASFDLSYIKFADEKHIPCLHFVLQDQIENVHSNQITNLLTEIVDEVNCQYVLPVLRDKLPQDIDVEQFEVLSLSRDSKLFKIQ